MKQSINAYNQDTDSTSMSIRNLTEKNTQIKNPNYSFGVEESGMNLELQKKGLQAENLQTITPQSFIYDGITVNVVHDGKADLNELVKELFLNY